MVYFDMNKLGPAKVHGSSYSVMESVRFTTYLRTSAAGNAGGGGGWWVVVVVVVGGGW